MRSLIIILLVLCGGSLLSNGASDSSQIREMSPFEPVTAAAEKEASPKKNYTPQNTPLHITFDEKHFNYSSEEWKPVVVPKVQQFDPLDTIMMIAVPSNPTKQVTISLDLPTNSSIVVRYSVFLTKNEQDPPEFKVLLSSSDGMDKFLKIEEPAGRWMNSSVELLSEMKDKIVFIAKLRDATNSIGLRFVTLQKTMGSYHGSNSEDESLDLAKMNNTSLPLLDEHDSFTYNSSNKGTNTTLSINDSLNLLSSTNYTLEGSGISLDNSSGTNETLTTVSSVLDQESSINTEVMFTTLSHTNPFFEPSGDKKTETSELHDEILDNSNNLLNSSNDGSFLPTELSPAINSSFKNSDTTSSRSISPSDDHFDLGFGMNHTVASANDTYGEGNKGTLKEDNESSLGIFHFFWVIMLTSIVVFLFIYIRRRRRRRDDELPVFRRSATEHGNPTYLDDETELDIGFSSSKYRSFN